MSIEVDSTTSLSTRLFLLKRIHVALFGWSFYRRSGVNCQSASTDLILQEVIFQEEKGRPDLMDGAFNSTHRLILVGTGAACFKSYLPPPRHSTLPVRRFLK